MMLSPTTISLILTSMFTTMIFMMTYVMSMSPNSMKNINQSMNWN